MNKTRYFFKDIAKYGRQFDTEVISNSQNLSVYDINSFQARFNSSLFQSTMRVLEIDSNIPIPERTIITGKLGIKFNEEDYDYLKYENYITIDKPEYNEDTKAYIIKAYDKMVESMIEYDLKISTYPISVKEFLILICNRLGWDTSNIPANFINSNTLIYEDIYSDIKYTFRDVLDEIAKITCSFPCFINGAFTLKYITETNEVITNDYLSEDDLTFEKEYYINSVVFSRTEDSDTFFKQDIEDINQNGLHEYKLKDLQILSTNNRSDFMNEIYEYLRELKFWIFDIKSTGIFIFDIADRFTIETDNKRYSVVALNSEGVAEGGLSEQLYAKEPVETETEYSSSTSDEKADRITRIIVDKQNKRITQLVQESNDKFSKIEQDVDSINQKVTNNIGLTSEKTQFNNLHIQDIPTGEQYVLDFKIYGGINFTSNKIKLVASTAPRNYIENLLTENVQDLLTEDSQEIITESGTFYLNYIDLELDDRLRALTVGEETYYDTLEISQDGTITITRRIGVDENGDLYLLSNLIITILDEKFIVPSLENGTYYFIENLSNLEYYSKYIVKNDYSDYLATKVEMNSEIKQTVESIELGVNKKLESYSTTEEMQASIKISADEINSTVSKKVGKDEVVSSINQTSEQVKINANKIELSANDILNLLAGNTINIESKNIVIASTNFNVDAKGNLKATNADITGKITASSGKIADYTISGAKLVGKNVGMSGSAGDGVAYWAGSDDIDNAPFRIGHDGSMKATNADITGKIHATSGEFTGTVHATSGEFTGTVNAKNGSFTGDVIIKSSNSIEVHNENGNIASKVVPTGFEVYDNNGGRVGYITAGLNSIDGTQYKTVAIVSDFGGRAYVYQNGLFVSGTINQTSLEREKKNIEKYENALNEVLNTEIYKYNLKTEEDSDKKHIGFVIGNKYNYSHQITSTDSTGNEIGVDTYSMISMLYQAFKEEHKNTQKQMKELKTQIEKLKGEKQWE